jgi:signal transduction histidine kinase
VTQSQNAETQLRRLNNTLEARIRDEVAKNRDKDHLMIHQSRMAAMGEMIGNIAHQWRQPLNALALTLANLRDAQRYGDLTPHYLQEQVSFGEELIRTMSATIEDFRNFYRSNRERKRFSVCIAAQKAVSIVQSAYAQQDIDLQFVCLKDGEMMGVENEYTQALLNLLGNSREIIQERGLASGQVQVKVDSNQQEAWITVTDNGQGIALDILPRIFDPYFTTRPKGIGIGLYMSKMIIENNFGGRIEVENTADGAEFRITTPLADAA